MTTHRTIRGMLPADWEIVDQACALTGATPRALLLVAANAAIREGSRSFVVAAAAQRATEDRTAATAAAPQLALPLSGRRRS